MGTKAKLCGCIGLVVAALFAAIQWFGSPDLDDAVAAFEAGDFAAAEEIARTVLETKTNELPAFLIAAESAARQSNRSQVVADLQSVTSTHPDVIDDLMRRAERLEENGALSGAELFLNRAVELAPDPHRLSKRVELLYLTGQMAELTNVLRPQLVSGQVLSTDLPLLSNPDLRMLDHLDRLEFAIENCPQDALGYLGKASIEQQANRVASAIELLLKARERAPELVEVHARLGWLLLGRGDPQALRDWHTQLPESALEHPGIWIVFGRLCRDRDRTEWARRCFWEAARLDPNRFIAVSQLGGLLNGTQHVDAARQLTERGRVLAALYLTTRGYFNAEGHPESILRELAAHTQALGRLAESTLCCRIAVAVHPDNDWARAMIESNESSRRPQDFRIEDLIDLSHLPQPDLETLLPTKTQDGTGRSPRFRDDTQAAGIDFTFVSTTDTARPRMRFFEFTGGGVGVIDYDGDRWPDLFLTQGGEPPLLGIESDRTRPGQLSDQLFRNAGDGRFTPVAELAGLSGTDYGQGCAVGDFNNDGFADLYVANIGANTLYENNGDGTFTRVDQDVFQQHECWTASCAIADVNGDGNPELIDVNHAPPNLVHTEMCRRHSMSVPCDNEVRLATEQDRMMLSRGDGQFDEVHDRIGMDLPEGLGLGIIVTDFDHDGATELFVANDGKPNFYFETTKDDSPIGFRLEERAHLYGLALSAEGRAQACMGVAVDDANGDSLPDLFVTNFYADSNTLYLQQPHGGFDDFTRSYGLRDSSYRLLGFGTQFLDAELDGHSDLVLANGDVDDFSAEPNVTDRPWQQPPQFMSNPGKGPFQDLSQTMTDDYFCGTFVGRGLALLDWNRDGLPDFAVSHIGSPAALVTNATEQHGHWIALTLRGTTLARDAVGAIVRVETEHQSWTKTLAAGDGYMASNERRLLFGLGDETEVKRITIRWPGDHVDEFVVATVDRDYTCVEAAPELFPHVDE